MPEIKGVVNTNFRYCYVLFSNIENKGMKLSAH